MININTSGESNKIDKIMNKQISSKKASILAAQKAKNDEFYTRQNDIVIELGHYKNHFIDKTVLLNCDDPETSQFFWYFRMQFKALGLKRLIATHYNSDSSSYALDITSDLIDYRGAYDIGKIKKLLVSDGDFRSPECIELLEQADIVVTNPPFSLFRKYVDQLIQYKKDFLIIGPIFALSYIDILTLLRKNEIWLGYTKPKCFILPDKTFGCFNCTRWYTNLDIDKRKDTLPLFKNYHTDKYPYYDNADAINIDKVADIPIDYFGIMGVPTTFLDHYSPNQFKIIGRDRECTKNRKGGFINGKEKYARVFIQRV